MMNRNERGVGGRICFGLEEVNWYEIDLMRKLRQIGRFELFKSSRSLANWDSDQFVQVT